MGVVVFFVSPSLLFFVVVDVVIVVWCFGFLVCLFWFKEWIHPILKAVQSILLRA